MTRPRSQQIDNLKTRHFRFAYVPTPGASSDIIADSPVFTASVTGVAPGSETQVTATVTTPTTGPFPIAPGDSFSVALDGGGATAVVLAGTDTTASRIAAAIIAAAGSPVASASAGLLSVFSLTPGAAGSVTLADVVPGTLAKLGLVPGTVAGSDPPVRGVVTRSSDGRGGYAVLKTSDGKDLVTDASSLMLLAEGFLPPIRTMERPGGVPLHARVTKPSGFVFRYYASLPTRPEVETFGSNFALLDGTDTFGVTVVDPSISYSAGPVTMTFPAGPGLTRDAVVTRINALWAAAVNGATGTGEAKITGSISGPYTWTGSNDDMEVSVDGGVFQFLTFAPTDVSASLVASKFNGAVTGATASVVSYGGGEFVKIESDNTDGTTSSLEFRSPGALSNVFKNLGIQAGKHRGYFVCQPSGPSEIKIFGTGRGDQATLDFTGSGTTLARMGITAGTHRGLDDGEEEVLFPEQNPASPGTGDAIVALVPEVMDFGEVPDSEESVTVKFGDRAPGTPMIQGLKNIYLDGFLSDGKGVPDAGKAPITGADGSLQPSVLGRVRAEYENFFKKFIRGDFSDRSVSALVATNIETPGTAGNPGSPSNEFTVDVDPDDALAFSLDRTFQVRVGRDASNVVPFHVIESTSWAIGLDYLVSALDSGGALSAFANEAGPMRFYDTNTDGAGFAVTGPRFLTMTSSVAAQGDRTLRIMEKEEGITEPATVVRQINARWTATCGDGTNSFGDFNGTDAIQQAIAFYNANVVTGGMTLSLKSGIFYVNPTNGAIAIPGGPVVITGSGLARTTIAMDVSVSFIMDAAAVGTRLTLRDMTVRGISGDAVIRVQQSCYLFAQDVNLTRCSVQATDAQSVQMSRCDIANQTSSTPTLSITSGTLSSVGPFTVQDCEVRSGTSTPVLRIRSGNAALSSIEQIRFVRCRMQLASTSVNGNANLTGNPGVIDIDPNGFNSLTGAQGARVRRVEWIDCDVDGPTSGAVSVLMHLIPIANDAATTGFPYDSSTDPAMMINEVVIRGGRWKAARISTSVNPFTIGLAVTANATDGVQFGRVTLKDWKFEFDTSGSASHGQGGPTVDVGAFFTSSITGEQGTVPIGNWGAVAISAMDLVVKDVELLGFNRAGDSGDLFLKVDRRADIDGILLDEYRVVPVAGIPFQRIRTRFGDTFATSRGFPNVSMRRVVARGTDSGALWVLGGAFSALWVHEPSASPVLVKDCDIDSFTVSTLAHPSPNFMILDAAQGSLWGTVGNVGHVDNLTIDGLRSARGTTGISLLAGGSGIFQMRRNVIRNCRIVDNGGYGVTWGTYAINVGAFSFLNNLVHRNGKTVVNSGVLVQCGDWTVADANLDPSQLTIVGNQVYDNTTLTSGVQMFVQSLVSQDPVGVCHGNNFTTNGLDGKFKIDRNGATIAPANPANYIGTPFRGVETGYRGEIGASDNLKRYFDSGNGMIQNSGGLVTP